MFFRFFFSSRSRHTGLRRDWSSDVCSSDLMIEEAVYDEDGQLITGSFMDYAMPRARDFPRFELDHTVTPSPPNPMGAKGIAEARTNGSTPCIANADVDALSPFDVQHIDMKLRPEKLWQAMQGGQS